MRGEHQPQPRCWHRGGTDRDAVGVDVEHREALASWGELTDVFADGELALLRATSGSDLAVRLWVRKEALVKLSGQGLGVSLREVDLTALREGIPGSAMAPGTCVRGLPLEPPYVGALACMRGPFVVRWRDLAPGALMALAEEHLP